MEQELRKKGSTKAILVLVPRNYKNKHYCPVWQQFLWIKELDRLQTWNGRSILIPSTDLVTSFDAPNYGWDGCFSHSHVSGHWHINWLVLKAAFLATQTFASTHNESHKILLMNNRTTLILRANIPLAS